MTIIGKITKLAANNDAPSGVAPESVEHSGDSHFGSLGNGIFGIDHASLVKKVSYDAPLRLLGDSNTDVVSSVTSTVSDMSQNDPSEENKKKNNHYKIKVCLQTFFILISNAMF